MPTRLWIRLAGIVVATAFAAIVLAAWRADRRDRAQLAADLATAHQALAQADARQHDRDAQLVQTLAALAAGKRAITTPGQIVRELPNQIPLPTPIALQTPDPPSKQRQAPCSSGSHWSSKGPVCGPEGLESAQPSTDPTRNTAANQAILPLEDLKPLYDFAIDCKACQAKLAATQADLTDERAKTAILTRERDEAVHVAKGGSLLRRIARNAKWLAIGAAAGAIAGKAHR
jgi:hypothetical protein